MGNLLKVVVTLLVVLETSSKIPGFWEHDARINAEGIRVCVIMCLLSPVSIYSVYGVESQGTHALTLMKSDIVRDCSSSGHIYPVKHSSTDNKL